MATTIKMGSLLPLITLLSAVTSLAQDIKGPPIAQQKELKKIVRVGEDVKIQCPISGNPTPMIEWKKGGETIDYSWIRIRTQKKAMKIKKAQEVDTGIYVCKGVNGFGNVEVRVDLIIIDPAKFPELGDGELPDVAPPVLTPDTKEAREIYQKKSGDSFKVTCEAVGNPQPEILWYKDGLPFDAEGIRYKNGKSTIKLRNLMKVDSAVYTCQAKNLVGSTTKNYTLAVTSVQVPDQPKVSGNGNTSVVVGETASLQCRVRSPGPPHIKWLKKQNPDSPDDIFTINVGDDRYRVIHTGEDVAVSGSEYLNKLVIHNAAERDSGLYICLVTNPGGSFNYKTSYLRVYPASTVERHDPFPGHVGESTHVLALVICLGITVVLILVFIIVCVVKKSTKSSNPDSPEVVRNLMAPSRSIHSSSTITTVASQKFDHPLPPPPSMWSHSGTAQKNGGSQNYMTSVSRDFASLHENSSTNLLSDRESPVSQTGNQYEVPYCHNQPPPGLDCGYNMRHIPAGTSHASGLNSDLPFPQYPYFQYLNDYDSY